MTKKKIQYSKDIIRNCNRNTLRIMNLSLIFDIQKKHPMSEKLFLHGVNAYFI